MKTKRNVVIAALGLALGTALVLTQAAWSEKGDQPFRLEGTWMGRMTGTTTLEYTLSFSPSDPSGREASFQVSAVEDDDPTLGGMFPDAEYETGFMGQAVVTGPNEAAYTLPYYGMRRVGGVSQIVYIAVDSGTMRRTGPGKTEVAHYVAFYYSNQDADGNGLPDKGQAPFLCFAATTIDTRLPLLPPCKP